MIKNKNIGNFKEEVHKPSRFMIDLANSQPVETVRPNLWRKLENRMFDHSKIDKRKKKNILSAYIPKEEINVAEHRIEETKEKIMDQLERIKNESKEFRFGPKNANDLIKSLESLAFFSIGKCLLLSFFRFSYFIGSIVLLFSKKISQGLSGAANSGLSLLSTGTIKTISIFGYFEEAQEKIDNSWVEKNIFNDKKDKNFILDKIENLVEEGIGQAHKKAQGSSYIKKLKKKIEREKEELKKISTRKLFRKDERFSWKDLKPEFSLENFKRFAAFSAVLLLLMIPFLSAVYVQSLLNTKDRVLADAGGATSDMIMAAESIKNMDLNGAKSSFCNAGEKISRAKEEFNDINNIVIELAAFIPNEKIRMAANGKEILSLAKETAEMGENLTAAFSNLFSGDKAFTKSLSAFSTHSRSAVVNAKNVGFYLSDINPTAVPVEHRDKFKSVKSQIKDLEIALGELSDIADKLKVLLGDSQDKRYLLVFQNNAEMRASGGFIGSYALIDFKEGKIKNIETPGGGSYDTEAGLKERLIAPEALHIINPLWHFWDANWWPDWPITARKLMWFYERSDGPTVDGVISFTPTVVEDLLGAIGPIDMPEYGTVVDKDNFWRIAQDYSESKRQTQDDPKKFIGDLMNRMIEELPARLNKESLLGILQAAEKSLSSKHILVYLNDSELEKKVMDYGWDGKMKDTEFDYLMVVNSSVAGGKSDKKIRQTIKHEARIEADGSIVDKVTVKREHTAYKNEPHVGLRNVDYMRFYVPAGSEFIRASGFEKPDQSNFEEPQADWQRDPDLYAEENSLQDLQSDTKIYKENGKTVFANWSQIDPGQTVELTVEYRLPFMLFPEGRAPRQLGWLERIGNFINPSKKEIWPYSLLIQKQPGSQNAFLESRLSAANNFTSVWSWPSDLSSEDDIIWSSNISQEADMMRASAFIKN